VLIVTLPTSAAADPADFARRARAAGVDVLEVRGDLTPGLAPFASALPLLLAPRGGDLTALAARGAAWVDQEDGETHLDVPGASRIASFHDHGGTPPTAELVERGRAAFARGADLVKLACTAQDYADLARLDDVRRALRPLGRVAVLAMGALAELDRVRSPWRNAATYAALAADLASAPGQLDVARHVELAGPDEPPVYGILGGPAFTARSASPRLFRTLCGRHGVRAAHVRLPSADATRDLATLRALGVRGLAVTAPHKLAAARFADVRSRDAERCGAANTLELGARTTAHQFDALGIERGYPGLAHRPGPVAVVGSGGVVPAVLLAAERLGLARPTVHARNAAAAAELAARFGVRAAPLAELARARPSLLVNCLPLDPPELELPAPAPGAIALDLRYGSRTPFMERAAARGYTVHDGAAMLVHQALAQFELFTGRRTGPADAEALLAAL
jgi:shikimate 5-dehydrogenase